MPTSPPADADLRGNARRRRLLARIGPIAALLLAGAGCGRAKEPLTLGASGPWHLEYGQSERRGMEMGVEEINRAGGIRGRPLRVEFRNDSTDGVRAVAIAQDFVADPRILAVIGPVNSGAMIAAAKVYHGHLVSVGPTAASPELSGISPWVFRLIASDSVFAGFLGEQASRMAARAAVLYDNNAFGRGGAEAFSRSYRGSLAGVDPILPGVSSLEPHITYLRTHGVGLVYVAGNTESALAVLREARRQGFRGAILGSDSWTPIVADTALAEDTYIGLRYTTTDPRPEVAGFVERYRRRFGAPPDGFAAFAYDATRLLAGAIAARGASRERIREHLASLTAATAFRGITGSIHFDSSGGPVAQRFVLMRVHRGALVPVGGDGGR
jgi:branched-chain amino acid transport system substrate-binding protein